MPPNPGIYFPNMSIPTEYRMSKTVWLLHADFPNRLPQDTLVDLINIDQYRLSFGIKESLDNFFSKRYISCAHVLFSTLEGLVRSYKIKIWKKILIRFFDNTVKTEFEHTNIDNRITKYLLLQKSTWCYHHSMQHYLGFMVWNQNINLEISIA